MATNEKESASNILVLYLEFVQRDQQRDVSHFERTQDLRSVNRSESAERRTRHRVATQSAVGRRGGRGSEALE